MVVALLKVRPETRKLKRDGAAVLVTAATAHSAELSDQVAELQAETRKLWQGQRQQQNLLSAHHRWDEEVVAVVRSLGGTIDDPPPLYAEG
ncbi:hypothetical protein [Amycolatopsis sp. BJA-103]|uniref:hypothetical protein n=1 Tax=Amycolatopsis sp. BJA-103 TaxID=1911175 RepID=UPI0011AEEF28|nr:hypothetical protein [Amycolatopsis sp. BJA-103]